MALATYELGDTIEIPVTFTDLTSGVQAPVVPDAMIAIFMGNTQILAPTAMTQITGGEYYYTYTISPTATLGVYTVYITGTVNSNLQTATFSFSVSNRLTNLQTSVNALTLNVQANQVDTDTQFALVGANIGNPIANSTTLYQELQTIITDIGNPIATGQDLTGKLDNIQAALGLGTTLGTVAVTGTVVDNNNLPIAGVRVIAINTSTGSAVDTGVTDSTGTYTMYLNPCNYIFEFVQVTTILQQSISVTVPTLITALTVPPTQLATKRTVTDVVNDPQGNPLPGVLVKAIYQANFNANAAENKVEAAAFTDDTGSFMLSLFPGTYIFQFVKFGFDTLPEEFTVV
jgi:hypothetical protein